MTGRAGSGLVFEAMTTPEHVRRQWGGQGEGYSVPGLGYDQLENLVAELQQS